MTTPQFVLSEMRQRRGTSAQWAAADRVLAAGEVGVDVTVGRVKVGDGSTAWSALPWLTVAEDDAEALLDGLDSHLGDDPVAHPAEQISYDGPAGGSTVAAGLDLIAEGKRDVDDPWRLGEIMSPVARLSFFDDFLYHTIGNDGRWLREVSGSGADAAIGIGETTGVVRMPTGTTTSGAASITGPFLPFAGIAAFRVKVNELPTTAQSYIASVGFGSILSPAQTLVAIAANENVRLVTTHDGSTTMTDTGHAMEPDEWTTFELTRFGGFALLSINGGDPIAAADDVPPADLAMPIVCAILKQAGTTSRTLRVDYVTYEGEVNR